VVAFLGADLACETRSGANRPGGHLQSDEVTIQPQRGQITLPTRTTAAAECPPGLNPVVGDTIVLVIENAEGERIFEARLPVS
jgi:hypothetical protein